MKHHWSILHMIRMALEQYYRKYFVECRVAEFSRPANHLYYIGGVAFKFPTKIIYQYIIVTDRQLGIRKRSDSYYGHMIEDIVKEINDGLVKRYKELP